MPRPKGSKNKNGYDMSEIARLQRIVAPLKDGKQSATLARYSGCNKCPYKHKCEMFDENNNEGCEARRRQLLNSMLEVSDSGLMLMNKAGILTADFDEFREKLINVGKNPLEDPMYQKAANMLIELAKWMKKLKLDERKAKTYDEHSMDKEEVILVAEDGYGELDE